MSGGASWGELVDMAVVGTSRARLLAVSPLLAAAGLDQDDDQIRLLDHAAALSRARRAGYRPPEPRSREEPAAAELDDRSEPGPAARRRLAELLVTPVSELIVEWLRLLAAARRRPPDVLLPALLAAATSRSELRPALLPVLGPLAGWLAGFNGEWDWVRGSGPVAAQPGEGELAQVWQTGSLGARQALLARLRAEDPAAGRDLVASTWATDSYRDRAAFLAALATGLSLDDEPLAEQGRADRRAEVRRSACDLLARLPGSGFSQRAVAQAGAAVRVEGAAGVASAVPPQLVVSPPGEATAELIADGVDGSAPRGAGVQAWLLYQVVAAAPAQFWPGHTGLEPAGLLALSGQAPWRDPLRAGWAQAAIRDADPDWLVALLDLSQAEPGQRGGRSARDLDSDLRLLSAMPALTREDWLSDHPGSPLLLPALEPLAGPWSARLSDLVRSALTAIALADPGYSPAPRALFRLAAMRLEPPVPPREVAVHERLAASWSDLLTTLSVRMTMRRELAEEPHS